MLHIRVEQRLSSNEQGFSYALLDDFLLYSVRGVLGFILLFGRIINQCIIAEKEYVLHMIGICNGTTGKFISKPSTCQHVEITATILSCVTGALAPMYFGSRKTIGFCAIYTSISASVFLFYFKAQQTTAQNVAVFIFLFLDVMTDCILLMSYFVFWSLWSQVPERCRTLGITVYAGVAFAKIVSIKHSGKAFDSNTAKMTLIALSLLGFIWSVIWFTCSADSPKKHRNITMKEMSLLKSQNQVDQFEIRRALKRIPWSRMLVSSNVWILLLAIGFYFSGLQMVDRVAEEHLARKHEQSMEMNNKYYLILNIASIILSAAFSDTLIEKGLTSMINARKLCAGIGTYIPGITLIICIFLKGKSFEQKILPLRGFSGFNLGGGMLICCMDIAPTLSNVTIGMVVIFYSAMYYGLSYGMAAIFLTDKIEDASEMVLIISALLFFLSGSLFVFYGTTAIQSWALEAFESPFLRSSMVSSLQGDDCSLHETNTSTILR